mmetsp:Transcript_118101/g.329257  ORF Transcript_118101/g.329257 Transcript_118101/m.329257 type:complete len:315 (-) Transcript_118101:307-1251(-)|eukprot:CAMPEP_0179047756 /NCGR_PEP_ID=MMETSP0796-20121207/19359_1 /TAXON_ID=73915 /ORGANISM="Pyrodinium bahamense, Strain pbaha01" /LENGTH=314 /DNA_ID=CAMNT_0020744207 /DNA_START=41 /DNA_END=985 /DNA_ORIENTATION=-
MAFLVHNGVLCKKKWFCPVLFPGSAEAPSSATCASMADRAAGARAAYYNGDVEAAKQLHDPVELSRLMAEIQVHEEPEALDGGMVKPLVFGGLDGIITTFAVVAGAMGAALTPPQVLVMGFANLLADGFSMGFGEYTSSKAELEFARNERKREAWEFKNFPEGEMKEMVEIYKQKGVSEEDSCTVIATLAKYKDVFVDHMMVEELGLLPPEADENPLKQGLVMFFAFCTFGAIPLVGFMTIMFLCGSAGAGDFQNVAFHCSCALTALTLMSLGAVKARYTKQSKVVASLLMLLNGTIAGAAAFLIGEVLHKVFA